MEKYIEKLKAFQALADELMRFKYARQSPHVDIQSPTRDYNILLYASCFVDDELKRLEKVANSQEEVDHAETTRTTSS